MSRIFRSSFGFGGGRQALDVTPELNLTPMIDVMTIILIFLVKSYSITPENLQPSPGVKLSVTASDEAAQDRAVLVISAEGIKLDDQIVVPFTNGQPNAALLRQDTIPQVEAALARIMKSSKYKGNNTLIIQADRHLAFDYIKPILRTASAVGYHDIKFAGIFEE